MSKTELLLKHVTVMALFSVCSTAYAENDDKNICIDKGRQLFVDEYLIENTDLERRAHRAEKIGKIMEAETELEMGRGLSKSGQ